VLSFQGAKWALFDHNIYMMMLGSNK